LRPGSGYPICAAMAVLSHAGADPADVLRR
jgi:hypothetical protein